MTLKSGSTKGASTRARTRPMETPGTVCGDRSRLNKPCGLSGFVCLGLEGYPDRTSGNDGMCLFSTPAVGKPGDTRKARTVVASRCPRLTGWPEKRLEGLIPGTLPSSSPFEGSADTHRHARLWASGEILKSLLKIKWVNPKILLSKIAFVLSV